MSQRWQIGDRVRGDRPQDVGTVRSHEGIKLIIACDDGSPLFTSQESAEELGWRRIERNLTEGNQREETQEENKSGN